MQMRSGLRSQQRAALQIKIRNKIKKRINLTEPLTELEVPEELDGRLLAEAAIGRMGRTVLGRCATHL
jgi:hypothetical protein